jgi:hypothetical protein
MDCHHSCWVGKVSLPIIIFAELISRALLGMYRSVNKMSRRILERLELAILEVEE